MGLLRNLWRDRGGSYAIMTAITMVPLLGGLALAIDYGEMLRQQQQTLNALDAAGIATARRILSGEDDAAVKAYAKQFFEANLGSVDPADTTLAVLLPEDNAAGGGTLKLTAALKYDPYFLPAFQSLLGKESVDYVLNFSAESQVRLKNTIEVALVLDNSGSMDEKGTGSGKKRIDLLKLAAKQLVDKLASQAAMMKNVPEPVRISIVPFAASVNVGPANKTKSWMDTSGASPIHHENFNGWAAMSQSANAAKYVQKHTDGLYYARGSGWGAARDKPVSRFTLYDGITRIASSSTKNGVTTNTYANPVSWEGCVEARPSPYNRTDDPASLSTPATLFVPMFAPDEAGNVWTTQVENKKTVVKTFDAPNSWWDDGTTSTSTAAADMLARQSSVAKYFTVAPQSAAMPAAHAGPNYMCTTTPILPLTDVTVTAGMNSVKGAIEAMGPNGATNVPEGLAWGWRTVSSGAPFTEGRPDIEKGNDKVVIVLTDGENTYYTPSSLGYTDYAGNKSIYSNYGYTVIKYPGNATTRLFMDTTVTKTDYSNTNYTKAMNQHFTALCANAKAKKIILMTVALDLSTKVAAEKEQIEQLKACASESNHRKEPDGMPAKLFWNSTGSTLTEDFEEIADELSNLRIVG